MQEQERSLRDFLEITSAKKRLVLLILPGNYRDYKNYSYRETSDEYARFINSVTNGSSSVLYLSPRNLLMGTCRKNQGSIF